MKRHFLDFIMMHPPALPTAERFFALVREHPNLCVLKDETHYFSSDKIAKGRDWYEAQYPACGPDTKRGECSTSYLATPGVAVRVAREYPDARLFVLVADPVELVATYYEQAVRGKATPPDLESWLEQQPQLLESLKFGRQLTHFFTYYSPVDLLVATFDDVRSNAGAVIIKLYDHLGVSTNFIPKVLRVLTEDEAVRPGWFARKLRLDRLRKYKRARRLAVANAVFPPLVQTLGARQRILLARYFEHDVDQLSLLVHRNLKNEWRYPDVKPGKSKK